MGYLNDARVRARRRKSPWNLLLFPAAIIPWFTLWWFSVRLFGQFARLVHPDLVFVILPDTRGAILIGLGLLFAWLGPAMIVGDLLVSLVPGARRALDAEAAPFPETGLKASIRSVFRLSAFLTPVGLVAAIVGVMIPW
jgi:hypothetical protein